jgi:hypothetical protein
VGGAVIVKRASSVECVIERGALINKSRVPHSIGHPRGTRGGAVTTRAPGPMHGIAWVNRHRFRREAETIVANRNRNRGRACHTRAERQKRSDNPQQYCNA